MWSPCQSQKYWKVWNDLKRLKKYINYTYVCSNFKRTFKVRELDKWTSVPLDLLNSVGKVNIESLTFWFGDQSWCSCLFSPGEELQIGGPGNTEKTTTSHKVSTWGGLFTQYNNVSQAIVKSPSLEPVTAFFSASTPGWLRAQRMSSKENVWLGGLNVWILSLFASPTLPHFPPLSLCVNPKTNQMYESKLILKN